MTALWVVDSPAASEGRIQKKGRKMDRFLMIEAFVRVADSGSFAEARIRLSDGAASRVL